MEYQRDKVSERETNSKTENARGMYKDILNSRNFGAVDEGREWAVQ
jgi:hypothetical protein